MKQRTLISTGLFSAIAASLCCITPILALVAGTSGAVSSFAWIAPFRPYLVILTIGVLGFAWFPKLKPSTIEVDSCGCEVEKPKFIQSKTFLGIVTLFAVFMLSLPYLMGSLNQSSNSQVNLIASRNLSKREFQITGMTCESCEQHITHAINKLPGIGKTVVSYKEASAVVEYDSSKVTANQLIAAINATGYKVNQ